MRIEIVCDFSEGVNSGADISEFKRQLGDQLERLTQRQIDVQEKPPEISEDGREALGAEELLRFTVENFDSIVDYLKALRLLILVSSDLSELYLKLKPRKRKDEPKSKSGKETEEPTKAKIVIDGVEYGLPLKSSEVDHIVKLIREQQEKE